MTAMDPVPGIETVTQPWIMYARAVVELVLDGRHLVLTPSEAAVPGPDLDPLAVFGPPIWVLTAGGPYPLELDPSANAARLERLCEELDTLGMQHDPALGRSPDGTTSEISRAVRGADRTRVLELAAQHGQLAVYEITERIDCVDVASATVITSRAYGLRSAPAGSAGIVGPTGWRG